LRVRYNAAMNVRLKPETEKLIQQDLQSGIFQSVDEYVENAVSLLHQREAWLAENRAEISAKIEKGLRRGAAWRTAFRARSAQRHGRA
jgi:putative addiction module CopG family antidote